MSDQPAAARLTAALPAAWRDAARLEAHAADLPAVARCVRDQLGYAMLTNLTAVDDLARGEIEVVYHVASPAGGAPLAFRARTPRAAARLPSLVACWPGAELQEREAYDLFGVTFDGHPDLRRIYLWDGFVGHPMRRDFPRQGDKYIAGAGEE